MVIHCFAPLEDGQKHIFRQLATAGYVTEEKTFMGKRSCTLCSIIPIGPKAFETNVETLHEYLNLSSNTDQPSTNYVLTSNTTVMVKLKIISPLVPLYSDFMPIFAMSWKILAICGKMNC